MGLLSVQVPNRAPRSKSTLEQVAEGVDIASKILGTGIEAYKVFGVEKPKAEAEGAYLKAHANTINNPYYMQPLPGQQPMGQVPGPNGEAIPVVPRQEPQWANTEAMHAQVTANQAKKTEDSAFFKAQNDLEALRGNTALRNANEVLRLAGNAKAIMNPYMKNLSDAPNDQVNLFDTEMAKIATGGVPTEAEMHQIQDPTLYKQFSSFVSKLKNAPQGAGQAEFLPNKLRYLNDLEDNAKNLINNSYNRKLNNWKTKLNPEDFQNLQTNMKDFLNSFENTPVITGPNGQAHLPVAPSNPSAPSPDAVQQELRKRGLIQ